MLNKKTGSYSTHLPKIAGTGSNDIAYAIDLTKFACETGYDGILLVTPYYNKATQNGLIKSFTAIADESTKPCILYNVPSGTGVNIEPETYRVLADHPMITGIKEANSNISKIVETMSLVFFLSAARVLFPCFPTCCPVRPRSCAKDSLRATLWRA